MLAASGGANKKASPGRGKARKKRPEDGGVASVDRALQILSLFRYSRTPLSLAEISEQTDLYKSTLLRLFQSLERFDFLEKTEEGTYRLGIAIQHLGTVARGSFRPADSIMSSLQTLTAATLESGAFYVTVESKRLCLYRVDSPQTVRATVAVGEALPLEVGASGHVLTVFKDGWKPALSPRVVVKTVGERDPDLAAIAAPVFGEADTLAGALSIAGPVNRFTDQLVEIATSAIVREAKRLSIQMGASPACIEFLESYIPGTSSAAANA